jgi:hypothetical protein
MQNIQKILVLILILVIGVSAIPGAAQDQEDEFQLYLPILMRNYPHHPIFGVEITKNGLMDEAAAAGNHWVRYNGLLWSEVQPVEEPIFNWNSTLEADLITASEAGMEVILVVRSTPTWTQKYNGYFCGPPADLNAFASFMSNVVKRYSSPPFNVKYYEIWNEPDVDPYEHYTSITSQYGCWGNAKDAYYGGGYYAEMLKVVYPAMKAANPSVNVVLGGLLLDCDPRSFGDGYCPTEERTKAPKFFEGILKNEGGAFFDVVSFHGYPTFQKDVNPILNEINFETWKVAGGVVAGKLDYINSLMSLYGINKPIFHTEGGLILPNNSPSLPSTPEFETAKANYLPWLFARNWENGIQATNWFTLNYPGFRMSSLLDINGERLPAYNSFALMTEKLGKAEFVSYTILGVVLPEPNYDPNEIHRFEFKTNDMRIWLLFGTKDNNSRIIAVPSKFIQAYDIVGSPVIPVGESITFDRPIYIEMDK